MYIMILFSIVATALPELKSHICRQERDNISVFSSVKLFLREFLIFHSITPFLFLGKKIASKAISALLAFEILCFLWKQAVNITLGINKSSDFNYIIYDNIENEKVADRYFIVLMFALS